MLLAASHSPCDPAEHQEQPGDHHDRHDVLMPATAGLAAATGPLQHADAVAQIPILGQEGVRFVDLQLGGRGSGRFSRWCGGLGRLRGKQADGERQREQDADEPRA